MVAIILLLFSAMNIRAFSSLCNDLRRPKPIGGEKSVRVHTAAVLFGKFYARHSYPDYFSFRQFALPHLRPDRTHENVISAVVVSYTTAEKYVQNCCAMQPLCNAAPCHL